MATGAPCQDWAGTLAFDNGCVAVTLSDGAGSSKYSHYGANLVSTRAATLISEHFEEAFGGSNRADQFKQRLIRHLQIDLCDLAKLGIDFPEDERARYNMPSRNHSLLVSCDVTDLSCTLLCVVVRGNRYVAIHVGDGVVGMEYLQRGKTKLSVISHPDNGEFANETYFITSGSAISTARIITGRINDSRKRITGFILMSDGPEAALYNKRENALAPACSKLLEANRQLDPEDMQEQLEATLMQVIARKTSDDCSLAMMSFCE